ncbi:hypothetical protein [Gimesia aquarii]|uniref:Uncharacterized protein n=1 Tax=Gimesia aquarii TaxID=2527964 RepID=A0A517WRG1_9PLAN|nr:hypothetical protein [Gimesia aquarii]QDU07844.1 hypothetical protein V202x_12050 [Gimesia aquarii]
MTRFLHSILLVACIIPFQFGCGGEEAPMTPESAEDPVEQLDPATEAAAQKKAMKENR